VRTGADGVYTLPNVPAGDYVVTADGKDILYGSASNNVTVNVGNTTTSNFALAAADGTLAATVTDVDTACHCRTPASRRGPRTACSSRLSLTARAR